MKPPELTIEGLDRLSKGFDQCEEALCYLDIIGCLRHSYRTDCQRKMADYWNKAKYNCKEKVK